MLGNIHNGGEANDLPLKLQTIPSVTAAIIFSCLDMIFRNYILICINDYVFLIYLANC